MKKLSYIIILLCVSTFTFGQDEVSSDAKVKADNSSYGPEAGDIAIGVDVIPYINFVGNMFNGTANNSLNLGSTTIYGKYYLSSDAAVRAEFYINNSTNTDMKYSRDDANFLTNPNAQVEDKRVIKNSYTGFGAGYQMYKGNGRLRGTYGAVASYYFGKNTTTYDWGNKMSSANTTPTSHNWGGIDPANRNLEVKTSGRSTISAGLIGGIEYYLAKKICVGGELGVYYAYTSDKQEHRTYQTVEQGEVREYELATQPEESYSRITTSVYGGQSVAGRLYVLFHF